MQHEAFSPTPDQYPTARSCFGLVSGPAAPAWSQKVGIGGGMKIVTMDPRKCVACGHCENACAFHRSGNYDHRNSAIRVNHYPEKSACIPMTCVHCQVAWCMDGCPAAAISRCVETDAVLIDADRCIGCKICMLACPFGVINFDTEKLVCFKCDLCGGDPKCVQHCFPGALEFENEEAIALGNRNHHDNRLIAMFGRENHD